MVHSSRPTFAEASDVASAVLDGTDAIVLSNATANGVNPVAVVNITAKICAETERCIDNK